MAISGKLLADFTSFYDAVTKAEVSLKSFEGGAGKVEGSLNRMTDSFSGRKIITDATLAAEAVDRIGGASKLTEAEQRKVNATVTEALAKYKALGEQAPDALLKLAAATTKVDDPLKTLSDRAAALGPKFTQLGTQVTAAVTVPIVGVLALATTAAIDFESAFAGVRKTVDATEPEFAALSAGLRQMATEIPVNVTELNKIAEAAGQLGIKKEDILQFTRTMAALGVTTNLTADEAATATAQIQNIFGAAGKDVDRFGATLVALGNAGASTEKDIISMGLRIAGAGTTVGLTQAQVLGFASGLSSIGINAEAGGSAISRVFLKINDAVAKGGGDLDEFARIAGVSSAAYKKSFETDAAGATIAFIQGLARVKREGENVNATLEGVVGKNIILKDTLMRAAGAGTLMADSVALGTKAWAENAALTKEAEARYATFASQFVMLKNKLQDVAITLGDALMPTLRDLVSVATPAIERLANMAKWFGELSPAVRLTGLAFLALAAAVGPALLIMGQLSNVVVAMTAMGGVGGLAASVGVLKTGLGMLWPVVAVGATAFAAWNLGRLIGETSGLTDKIEYLTLRMTGFNAEAATSAIELRKRIEAERAARDAASDHAGAIAQTTTALQAQTPAVAAATLATERLAEAHAAATAGVAASTIVHGNAMEAWTREREEWERHQKVLPPLTGLLTGLDRSLGSAAVATGILTTGLRFQAEVIETELKPQIEEVIEGYIAMSERAAEAFRAQQRTLPNVNPSTGEGMQGIDPAVAMYLGQGYTLGEAMALAGGYGHYIGAPHGRWDDTGWHEGRASGGPVTAGRSYMVGERGPELFKPSSSGSILPNGSGGSVFNVAVHVGNVISTKQELAALVRQALVDFARSQGQLLGSRA